MSWIDELIPNSDVPNGTSGDWKIDRFSVSEENAKLFNVRQSISMGGISAGRRINPGTYSRLSRDQVVIMSDTPAEKRDHIDFVRGAVGRILIGGLGMGLVLNAVARKEAVIHVDVVEIDDGPIALVWDFYKERFDGKINLIQTDLLEFKPKGFDLYDSAWFDIWDDICSDNWEEYKLLMRRWARKSKMKDCWARPTLLYLRQQEVRERHYW